MTTTTAVYSPAASGRWTTFVRRNAALFVVYGLLLVMFVAASLLSERFLTARNISNVLRQTAFLGTLALGQTLVILTGGIDLSVGSLVKLSLLVSAIVMNGHPENLWVGVAAVLALGAVVGLINGAITVQFRVPPFITTLGMYSILRGVSLAIASKPVGRASPAMLAAYDAKLGPVPLWVIFFAVLFVVLVLVLRRTRFGRHIYAVGGSEQVARLSGVRVSRVRYGVFVICSMLAAVTGLMYLSRMGIGDPVVGDGLELESITAVILGGTSLFGGRGTLIGTLGGVLLLTLTGNLLVIFNVNQWIQQLIEGLIIVGAVALYKQPGRK